MALIGAGRGPRSRPVSFGAAAVRLSGVCQAYAGAYHDFDWPDLKRTERPEFTTASGVVPITGADPAARDDVLRRVPAFLAPYLTR